MQQKEDSPRNTLKTAQQEEEAKIKPLYDQDLVNSSVNSRQVRADIKTIFKNNNRRKPAEASSSSVVYKTIVQASTANTKSINI
jgi:hypothetical protein